jgi:hypothetical protein
MIIYMHNWLSKMCKREVPLSKFMDLNVEGNSFSLVSCIRYANLKHGGLHFLVIFFTKSQNIDNYSWLLKSRPISEL